ncbi:hypothetical protein E4N62_15345 [Streptomyces sp. MNU76]|nr:hypothetical protein [Streptomyces sp. MNU76]MCC9706525.1 hypothetical protein [Streptomyces sp. MNU76]
MSVPRLPNRTRGSSHWPYNSRTARFGLFQDACTAEPTDFTDTDRNNNRT